jgi:hypothetical protein
MLILSIVGGIVLLIVAVLGVRWVAENVVIKSETSETSETKKEESKLT